MSASPDTSDVAGPPRIPPVDRSAESRPSVRWLGAWMNERFPVANWIFFALLYALVLVVSRAAAGDAPITAGLPDLAGLAAVCSFFLLLRVYDEHKDYEADLVAHPGRVLQRGLITLAMLRWIGVVSVAIQLSVSLWRDGGLGAATGWWFLALSWSALMAREFFAGEWLRPRLMLYALSHMMVMPLVVGWNMALVTSTAPDFRVLACLGALVFTGALAFEIARKLRAPADEHPMAATYTQSLGIARSAGLLGAVILAMGAVATIVPAGILGIRPVWMYLAIGHAVGAAVIATLMFGARPTRNRAKACEALVGYALVVAHVSVIAAMIQVLGFAWQ